MEQCKAATDHLLSSAPIGRTAMKTILFALIALSVLTGITAPANAPLEANTFYEQADRGRY